MITQTLEQVRSKFPMARAENDGSITVPECPVCRDEDHPQKSIKLYVDAAGKLSGITCARFASAGAEANREHCSPIREMLGVSAPTPAFISSVLFSGGRQVTLEIERVNKQVQFVTARNCTSVLHSAEVRLAKPDERAAFVEAIPDREKEERAEIGRELVQLLDRFRRAQSAVDESTPEDGKESAATRLVKLAAEAELIHNADGEGFAVMMISGHKETWPLRSKGFKRWLQRRFFEQYEKAPGSQAVQDALGVIEGKALYEGEERGIFIRIGEREGKIYLDLADDQWRAVEIDSDGWRLVGLPPVEFRRAKGMLPLPVPERGGSLDVLRTFLNLEKNNKNDELWALMLGSLVMKFRPRGPYPVDVFTGPQGCGKTTRARVIRALVDPSSADTRSAPREMRDLHVAAGNEWLPVFDNLSRIPEWLSDGLCCLSTGGGMRTRELYSDSDESIFSTMRPMILTSITEVVERPDLLDRSIIFNLPEIERKKRKSEKILWAEFEQAKPRILGVILGAVSCALKNEDGVVIEEVSRLADFERWAAAAEPALGLKPESFLRAYRKNQNSANDLALEACPIAEPIIALVEKKREWLGKAAELFDRLYTNIEEEEKRRRKEQGWPKTPTALSGMLRRISPNLRLQGIAVTFDLNQGKQKRLIKIVRMIESNSVDVQKPLTRNDKTPIQDSGGESAYSCVLAYSDVENEGVPEEVEYAPEAMEHAQSTHTDKLGRPTQTQEPEELESSEYASTQEYALLPPESCDDQAVAMDTETERFDPKRGITARNARLMGISLSYDGDRADYVTDREAWPMLMPEPEQTVIFHNAKFDMGVLHRTELPLPGKWEDTMIAAHLLDENGKHELKPLAKELLGVEETMSFNEADRKRLTHPEIFNEYAKNDARYTFRLWPIFRQEMERQKLLPVYELEKRVVPVVMAMERAGMKLDVPTLEALGDLVKTDIERIKAEAFEHAGCRFDLNSPVKVAAILFDKLGVPSGKMTKNGQRSVDKETLEDVQGFHPAVDAVLCYRELDKLANTFIKKLPAYADETGRVHPEFKQLGTKTGRFSCSDPNIQQIPARSELGKKLRAAFIAETGHKLVVADWSQMEMRVLAQYSKDPLLVEAYTSETEVDLHTLTASRMFGKPLDAIEKSERTIAKMINFGIAYGITPLGLFNRLRPQGVDVTEEECKRFIDDYFKSYPGVRSFLNKAEQAVRERGYIKSLFGRRRRVAGKTQREIRQAQNFVIQATAADLAKDAMVRLNAALPEGAQLIAQIHDEFIVECPAEQAEGVRDLMTETMSRTPEGFTIPMRVDIHIGDNWGECK
jgi:DNA polymerase I